MDSRTAGPQIDIRRKFPFSDDGLSQTARPAVVDTKQPQLAWAGIDMAKAPSVDLEALDEALDKLTEEDPAKAELVKLRFFACLTMPEIARVMKISLATAERHWTYARTWLFAELKDRGDSAGR
jgi:DNA-directed RNA polymerase specialized sigma24 family protein